MELASPIDVKDGWEVLRVAVEEILRRVAGDKLVTEFKNLSTMLINFYLTNFLLHMFQFFTCSIVSALISLPSREAGPVSRHSLIAVNLRGGGMEVQPVSADIKNHHVHVLLPGEVRRGGGGGGRRGVG